MTVHSKPRLLLASSKIIHGNLWLQAPWNFETSGIIFVKFQKEKIVWINKAFFCSFLNVYKRQGGPGPLTNHLI